MTKDAIALAAQIGIPAAWVFAAVLLVLLVGAFIKAASTARELRVKERGHSLNVLKQLEIPEDTKNELLEQLVRDEVRKVAGVSLTSAERAALIPFVRSCDPKIRWVDIRESYHHIELSKGSEFGFKLRFTWPQKCIYFVSGCGYIAILAVTLTLLLLLLLGIYIEQELSPKLLLLSLIYVVLTLIVRDQWLGPYIRFRKLRRAFEAASPSKHKVAPIELSLKTHESDLAGGKEKSIDQEPKAGSANSV